MTELECSKLMSGGDRQMLAVETVEEYRKEIYRIASFQIEDGSVLIEAKVLNRKGEVVREIEKLIPAKGEKPEVLEERIGMLVGTLCSCGYDDACRSVV